MMTIHSKKVVLKAIGDVLHYESPGGDAVVVVYL
jgi:hypothetical protein